MIPADVASRLQVSSDAALRPVAPTQEISDKLAGLVAGQKVLAEIQALLPNGTYRALINQRNITLALPFSAKAGDSLELQVTESDGKLAFAVLSQSGGEAPVRESVSTTLSRTAQLISTLYAGEKGGGEGKASALPLNTNLPIASAPPKAAEDLVPLLKQAIVQSGMFYESHQAEWVEGRMPPGSLLQEPQGKLSSSAAFAAAAEQASAQATNPADARPTTAGSSPSSALAERHPEVSSAATADAKASPAPQASLPQSVTPQTAETQPGQIVAPQLQSLVQQQLEALASQNFSWQGQIWPGQDMQWEIDENGRGTQEEEPPPQWSTRLRLTLPNLGMIEARIQLQGSQVALSMSVADTGTRDLMRASGVLLQNQFDNAGLTLASMGVDATANEGSDGEA